MSVSITTVTVPMPDTDVCEAILQYVHSEWDIPLGAAVSVKHKNNVFLVTVETYEEHSSTED